METITLQKRKAPRAAFKLSAGARPAFASMTAGNFTAADLQATPLPAIGDLAGAAAPAKEKKGFKEVMSIASKRAFRGGAAGFVAGVIQVGSFMWLRTTMNYQYANGGSLGNAIGVLYKEGGIGRFYRGGGVVHRPTRTRPARTTL